MGYLVYITRAPSHSETEQFPIHLNEWRQVADHDSELAPSVDEWYERRAKGGGVERFHPWKYTNHPHEPSLWFMDGAIHVKSPDQVTIAKGSLRLNRPRPTPKS